ncbi:bifunctional 4-hydroxy-2-oxoglutarate aldolase/2-dehydro-3-deoxy-phosphogluconate aldolase [Streptomyces sp. SL13]|uniref:Bifunctional 4-hydroxy-2-oxoglutarate aldolase/2-dehydro-3-deoxy-phosphogluconate aldolase n=1 Tax=Streptantibioticus silvisoli TaxID=2705255 RepID=A0AA90HCC0_9ACTN|nr:bifunctional 4-hydroxy-2-oxoglutarate aldolase/2-dehydro-3-deoxy-phosphogluconate aldolase [Streptantibioticus silvisoli]MDI5966596.1 bifunctional 4-hydroxy-2-oxoglutarate aldolase/2-dehydro-3-deoxy-phosphogluconate aldolase [Streptantibioticus silvisoli]MDI5972307.1 bifunctional 4-hydroxy-2-oxoglutarate aldolase/2-dehydro-3-deoxy-phosphogluconate aldolase [Streptantibioticus silvisoli]
METVTGPLTGNTWFADAFADVPLMAILRGYDVDRTVELARTAWSLGIKIVEVTIQSDTAVAALRATVEAGRADGRPVGAGTVTDPGLAATAHAAGAAFTVAPGLSAEVVAASHAAGMPHLPGVATGTELQLAAGLGLTWVKAFPATVLGTGWFGAMRGPFPQLRYVATGGIDPGNAAAFLAAGADVVALGSALADPAALPAVAKLLAG